VNNKVHIFRVQKREGAVRPYIVKWRVEGRDKSNAFYTKREAEDRKRKLERAKEDGLIFSSSTGLPLEWSLGKLTFAEVVAEMSRLKLKSWEARTATSFGDAISASVAYLVQPKMRNKYPRHIKVKVAQEYIAKNKGTPLPPSKEEQEVIDYYGKYSLRLNEIDSTTIENLLEYLGTKLDGTTSSNAYYRRRHQALNQVFEYAYKKKYLIENPLVRAVFKLETDTKEILVDDVLDPAQCRQITAKILSRTSKTDPNLPLAIYTFTSISWLAGLRPSEVAGLKRKDIKLGKSNHIVVRQAAVSLKKSATPNHQSYVEKKLKGRGEGQKRLVPINSELEKILAPYVANLADNDYLFTEPTKKSAFPQGYKKKPISTDLVASWFEDARPSKDFTLYDLRHTNATILIYSGYNVIEVAKRLGHSPAVCLKYYTHVFRQAEGVTTDKEDKFLAPVPLPVIAKEKSKRTSVPKNKKTGRQK
jgi:integrase